jgi:hypothetical protein
MGGRGFAAPDQLLIRVRKCLDNVTLQKEPEFLGDVGVNIPHITQKFGDFSWNVT